MSVGNKIINAHSVVDLCRVCLTGAGTVPIYRREDDVAVEGVYSKLKLCFSEEIYDAPGYPKNVCERCNKLLDEIILFIDKYKQSCKKLRDVFNKDEYHKSTLVEKEEKGFIEIEKHETKIEEKIQEAIKEGSFILNESVTIKKIKKEMNEPLELNICEAYIDSDVNFFDTIVKTEIEEPIILEKKKKVKSKIYVKNKVKKKVWNHNSEKKEEKKKQQRHKNDKCSTFTNQNVNKDTTNDIENNKTQDKAEMLNQQNENEKLLNLCEICGKDFPTKARLTMHKFYNHSEHLNCSICSKEFTNSQGLQRHMKRMHSDDKKKCSACEKSFAYNSNLQTHYKQVHLKERSAKRHACIYCGKLYGMKKELVIHERAVHTGERPIVCSICNASFFHETYLTLHMRLHTGERPFKCPICEKGFTQPCNMKSHIKHNHRISDLSEEKLKSIHPRYIKFLKP